MATFRLILCFMLMGLAAEGQPLELLKETRSISLLESKSHARLLNREQGNGAPQNFDVTYYRCEWETDPAIRYITGKVTVYYTITQPTSTIVLDLMNDLTTDSIVQRNTRLSYTRPNNTIAIEFAGVENPGKKDSVTIYYQGVPANTGFGSFINGTHAGVPVMWTLSEPYGSRDWWPCKNGLDDKADSIDLIITTPSAYKAASNGLLQSENLVSGGAKKITHWKHRYPIATYLICIAVTNYVVFERSVQLDNTLLPVLTHCYPEDENEFSAGTQNLLDAMQLFHKNIAPYPFIKEKYGHVQFNWGGGMENQTSTFLINTNEVLVAHELAHHWFGNKITCGTWRDLWLNEGFATYLSRYYMEKKYPAKTIENRRKLIEDITSEPDGSVQVIDTADVNRLFNNRLTYDKASYLLTMLQFKLGDSAFFSGIRNYINDPALIYGFATTGDLKRNLESVSGQSLTKFFDQWYRGEGYPTYTVEWTELGSNSVKFTISQETSHSSVSFFDIPVTVRFKKGTLIRDFIVEPEKNGVTYLKNVGFIPDTVLIDPEYWILSKNNRSKKVSLTNAGNPKVEAYPNPIESLLNIYLHDFKQNKASVCLYNMGGQLVYKKAVQLFDGAEFLQLNFSHLAKGQYILKIIADDFTYSQPLIRK